MSNLPKEAWVNLFIVVATSIVIVRAVMRMPKGVKIFVIVTMLLFMGLIFYMANYHIEFLTDFMEKYNLGGVKF